VFINLSPFIPLSLNLKGAGEEILERGKPPLLPTLPLPLPREGDQGDGLLNNLKFKTLDYEVSNIVDSKMSAFDGLKE